MDAIPITWFFAIIAVVLVIASEAGFRLGHALPRLSDGVKESPVSAISGAILSLLAFILAFVFALASERYDTRRALVRDEADAIRTAYSRSTFLAEPDRSESAAMLRQYLGLRLVAVKSRELGQVQSAMIVSDGIQRRLWRAAVVNARKDLNSDIGALYIESLNEMTNLNARRIALGMQVRIPPALWLVLFLLSILGMLSVGHQTAIAGSRRTWMLLALALSFSLVMALIADLDRPAPQFLPISQQSLIDLQNWMSAPSEPPEASALGASRRDANEASRQAR